MYLKKNREFCLIFCLFVCLAELKMDHFRYDLQTINKKSGTGAKGVEGITFILWKRGTEQLGKGKGMSDPLNCICQHVTC